MSTENSTVSTSPPVAWTHVKGEWLPADCTATLGMQVIATQRPNSTVMLVDSRAAEELHLSFPQR